MHLAFLHAFPLDHSMWDEQRAIAPGRCTTPCLYQLGDSFEDWASRVLDSIDTHSLIAIGSSMGGSCALEMARQAPDRIAALVLVGTKAGHRPEPAVRDAYLDTLHHQGIRGMWPEISGWLGAAAQPEVVERIESLALSQETADLINAVQVFHSRTDHIAVVAQWEKPLLVMSGEHDPVIAEEKAMALSHLAPQAELHVMRGCGHFMNLERPHEFNQVLADFVRRVEAGRSAGPG